MAVNQLFLDSGVLLKGLVASVRKVAQVCHLIHGNVVNTRRGFINLEFADLALYIKRASG
jgi:hypothetical protein